MTSASNVIRKGNVVFLHVGEEWYRYDELSSQIGSGAMGVVYWGINCRTHQRVAIKMVRQQFANIQQIRERAKQESSLMFMHPNLIEMLGYCEWSPGSGPIWIISRLVQGQTIDSFLKDFQRNKNSAKKICSMFLSVLDALHFLHTGPNPILHLDVKPSNIMVEHGNNIRLMDLGISSTHNGSNMGSHGMMGTPNYAAPEQFLNDGQYGNVSVRTDIYEAGVTLYELLTENNPYKADTIQKTIEKHKKQDLPTSNLIPTPIMTVLLRATESMQQNRYESVAEFKTALINAMNTEEKSRGASVYLRIGLVVSLLVVVFAVLAFLFFNKVY